MYNQENKIEFINNMLEKNEYEYGYIKDIIQKFHSLKIYEEEVYKKDVSEFDKEEISEMFYNIDTTPNNLNSYSSILRQYIRFTNKTSFVGDVLDILKKSGVYDFAKDMKVAKGYFKSREEFYKLLSKVYNYRDKLVLALSYEGLKQVEIKDLKKTDFKGNILDINNEYCLELDENLVNIINNSITESYYTKSNGEISPNLKSDTIEYTDNIYLVKFTMMEKNRTEHAIRRIIALFKKPLKMDKLSSNKLIESSQLNYITYFKQKNSHDIGAELIRRYRLDDYSEAYILKYNTILKSFTNYYKISEADKESIVQFGVVNLLKRQNIDFSKYNKKSSKAKSKAEDNTKYGLIGEEILFQLLQKHYGESNVRRVNINNDYDGYDIELLDNNVAFEYIEAKTSNSNRFFMSINQVHAAEYLRDKYCIYLVCYSGKEDLDDKINIETIKGKINIYKIKDPYSLFEFNEFLVNPLYKLGKQFVVLNKEFEIRLEEKKMQTFEKVIL